jgi:mannose-6-phosphate isomerase-like protein (cupin superfamily)
MHGLASFTTTTAALPPRVHDPVGRQHLAFEWEDDEVLHVLAWVRPGGGVPPHVHPHQDELFAVLEGRMSFTLGRRKELRVAGESVLVPAGARHAYTNTGRTLARMRTRVTPGLDLQEFLETVAWLGRERHLVRLGSVRAPGGLRSLPHVAAMMRKHRATTRILNPPPLIQRWLLDRLAARASDRGA